FIVNVQHSSGEIPWFEGGYCDPWDHVESAMALSIGGEFAAAERAYQWLAENQLEDGSWWAAYKDGKPYDTDRRESNFVAYIATGVWHHYLISQDRQFLADYWPVVERAIDFVLGLQTEHGDISWGVDKQGDTMSDALVTGCSSIYKSLECAWNMSVTLDEPRQAWRRAREQLGRALQHKPERFDRTWESKARFSMDWFYPVLSGVVQQEKARKRLQSRWSEFVEKGLGCRCVADEPWVTVAESCELTMALMAAGERAKAVELFSWLPQWQTDDGSFWTGYQFDQAVLWPDEKPTWTAAAVLLAADALTEHTAAATLFTSVNLLEDKALGAGASSRS
ncbi:prenyltransferase, partial [bacterium]|nr:prenyltransferase [bacterium]